MVRINELQDCALKRAFLLLRDLATETVTEELRRLPEPIVLNFDVETLVDRGVYKTEEDALNNVIRDLWPLQEIYVIVRRKDGVKSMEPLFHSFRAEYVPSYMKHRKFKIEASKLVPVSAWPRIENYARWRY